MIKKFLSNESGATAIEYSLSAAIISVAILSATVSIGSSVNAKMQSASDGLQ